MEGDTFDQNRAKDEAWGEVVTGAPMGEFRDWNTGMHYPEMGYLEQNVEFPATTRDQDVAADAVRQGVMLNGTVPAEIKFPTQYYHALVFHTLLGGLVGVALFSLFRRG